MGKRINRLLLVAFLAVMCLTIFVGCYDEWLGPGNVLIARSVYVDGDDMREFIEQYVIASGYIVELPEDYTDLVGVSYALQSYKNIYTPDEFDNLSEMICLEFNVGGEKIGAFIVPNESRKLKKEGEKLIFTNKTPFDNLEGIKLLYDKDTAKAKGESLTHFTLQNMINKVYSKYLDGYKPSGVFKELLDTKDDYYITEVYNEIERSGAYASTMNECPRVCFHDPRDISAEEKQAWQMQVIKDILANMKCYYWTAPTAE